MSTDKASQRPDMKEYQLMCSVFEYLVKKGMAFCFLEDGRMISRESAKDYISKNHGAFCNAQ